MYYEDDKVFLWEPVLEKFQVIYDFSLSKGDSYMFEIADLENDIDTAIVEIDSVGYEQIGSISKKKFYVTYKCLYDDYYLNDTMSYSSIIIETIGDIYYMFNFIPEYFLVCDGNFSEGLRCYYDDTIELYETGIAPYCEYVEYVGIDDPVNSDDIKVVSPFINTTIVKNQYKYDFKYCVYDISGQSFKTGYLITGDNRLQIFRKGIFILEITDKEKNIIYRQKIIGN